MKTIFTVEDKELGWAGFQTAEEAGTGAIQINCYEDLAEFNDAKLGKVRQGALAKLTDVEKAALGLTKVKFATPTSTPPAAGSTTHLEGPSSPLTAPRKRGTLKICLIILVAALAGLMLGIISIRNGWGVLNFQTVFQKIRAAIPIAAGPPAPSVATSDDLQDTRKSTQMGQSGEPKGAPAPSLKPSDSAPKPAPLPEGFGHQKIPD